MSIAYTRYHATHDDRVFEDLVPDRRIVVYDLLLELGTADLQEHLDALGPAYRDADALIVRSSRATDLASLGEITASIEQPLWALLRTDEAFVPLPLTPTASAQQLPVDVATLRSVEVRSLLELSNALRHEDEYHYVLPSGLHTDTFIDIGRLFQSYVNVQRIADWVEDVVDAQTVLLTDTGALLPLLIEVQNRTWKRHGYQPDIHVFEEYPDTVLAVEQKVRTIQSRTPWCRILFLLSISSSGRLASWVTKAAPDTIVMPLCDTADTPHPNALLHLPITPIDHRSPTECSVRKIGIKGGTLELVYEADYTAVPVSQTIAKQQGPFWSMADRMKAVQLHVNQPYWADRSGVRHHPVYLDIPTLLRDPAFRQECVVKLQLLTPKPEVLLLPTHDAAHEAIHDLVTDALGELPVITAQGTTLDSTAATRLHSATSILIADDAAVTGRTISGLRRAVYGLIRHRYEEVQIFGFVVVHRPPTTQLRSNARDPFPPKGESLVFGAEVYLPPPTKYDCPWCREEALLWLFVNDLNDDAKRYADLRLQVLSRPLHAAPVAFGTDAMGPDAFTKDSFFGQLRHVAAAGAVSSVMVAMQQKELRDEGHRFRVFRLSSGLQYYDAVIAGTIFRMLRRRDVHWCGDEADVAGLLEAGMDVASQQPGFFAEIGLAAFDGKLPRGPVEAIIAQVPSEPAIDVVKQLFALRPDPSARASAIPSPPAGAEA